MRPCRTSDRPEEPFQSLPATMRAVVANGGGGPEVLAGRRAVRCRGPARARSSSRSPRPASTGRTFSSARAHYPPPPGASGHPRPRDRRRGRRARARGRPLRLGARGRWPSSRAAATPNTASRPRDERARRSRPACRWSRRARSPRPIFTVWTNVFERGRPQSRRDAAGPWRHLRHRHDGDPARQGLRRDACIATAGSDEKCAACREARRRSRDQLPRDQDFVAAVKAGDRRARRRRHPRHGRRRLYRAQLRGRGRRRAHRPDRLPARPARRRSTSAG